MPAMKEEVVDSWENIESDSEAPENLKDLKDPKVLQERPFTPDQPIPRVCHMTPVKKKPSRPAQDQDDNLTWEDLDFEDRPVTPNQPIVKHTPVAPKKKLSVSKTEDLFGNIDEVVQKELLAEEKTKKEKAAKPPKKVPEAPKEVPKGSNLKKKKNLPSLTYDNTKDKFEPY
jgi:hypothetical protein